MKRMRTIIKNVINHIDLHGCVYKKNNWTPEEMAKAIYNGNEPEIKEMYFKIFTAGVAYANDPRFEENDYDEQKIFELWQKETPM